MKKLYIFGIDTSKSKLDFSLNKKTKLIIHSEVINTYKEIKKWIINILKENKINIKDCLFALEHTGIYNNHLLKVLEEIDAEITVIHATEIKRSLGMTRGKNDKVDSKRVAEYSYRFADKLIEWHPKRESLKKLQYLNTLRKQLIKIKKMLIQSSSEIRSFCSLEIAEIINECSEQSLESILNDITKVEKSINEIYKKDKKLNRLKKIVTSVTGIGVQTATELIVTTNEFMKFSSFKKLACHAGVVPFTHQSGSSINGRSRVNHNANKALKSLLHMGAMSAIQINGEFKTYYDRKTKEGKEKMVVINAVRNKLIRIVFTLVKNNVMYDKNYKYNLTLP